VSGSPLLELEGVSAGYGPFRALFDVSFAVAERSVTALLGPNGAGKTTVARVCSSLIAPTSGRVLIEGEDVTGLPAWRVARRGVVHSVEGRSVFASLTVEENLVLTFRQALGKQAVASTLERAYETFPRLGERRGQEAGTLSGGEQRMLSLARVLAAPPRVLIADELSLGLAPIVVDEVYRVLGAIRDAGASLLIVEQQVTRALRLADQAVVLGKGAVQYVGPVAGLRDEAERLLPGSPV
jgi:branched-chain amino acid transport system ATP-binding protein